MNALNVKRLVTAAVLEEPEDEDGDEEGDEERDEEGDGETNIDPSKTLAIPVCSNLNSATIGYRKLSRSHGLDFRPEAGITPRQSMLSLRKRISGERL